MSKSSARLAISSITFTRKGAGVYPSTTIPGIIRERLGASQGGVPLYFRRIMGGQDSFHLMRRAGGQDFSGPYWLRPAGASLPSSFVEEGDVPGRPVKLAFMEKGDQAAIVARLDVMAARLGEVALSMPDAEQFIGTLMVAGLSERSIAELGAMGAGMVEIDTSSLARRAFPEAY